MCEIGALLVALTARPCMRLPRLALHLMPLFCPFASTSTPFHSWTTDWLTDCLIECRTTITGFQHHQLPQQLRSEQQSVRLVFSPVRGQQPTRISPSVYPSPLSPPLTVVHTPWLLLYNDDSMGFVYNSTGSTVIVWRPGQKVLFL